MNCFRFKNLFLEISVPVILTRTSGNRTQKPNEGLKRKRSAIVQWISRNILETGDMVMRKKRIVNAKKFFSRILIIAKIPTNKKNKMALIAARFDNCCTGICLNE
jgi:hypothetical protein